MVELVTSGFVSLIIGNLASYVFGSYDLASSFLVLFLVIVSLIIGIPPPFSFGLAVPLVVVLAAFGYLAIPIAALVGVAFGILSVASFLGGAGIR